ncbi:MAG: DUF2007 domain-containing protein [Planctomycetales bacterium]|nr:DUF2007 domain-containing protein [Planctomycetales bacterium]
MRTLQIFSNAVEAEILRTRLDAAGIMAVVNGGEVATMLSHIGSAVVRVRVEVAPEDFQRASEVLREDEIERAERTAWTCSRCDERNEPLFDLCWNCNKVRDDFDVSRPAYEIEPMVVHESGSFVVADQPARTTASENPYAPVLLSEDHRAFRADPFGLEHDTEIVELVSRVFRGAVIGVLVLPPLMTIYVLYLLIFRVPAVAYRDPGMFRRLIASWVLCVITFIFVAIILRTFV